MKTLVTEEFTNAINTDTPTLVDFWAPWCGPCKALAPIFESLSTEYEGKVNFAKVDIDSNNDLINQLNIKAVPTLVLFKNGSEVVRLVGSKTADQIKEILPTE